MREVGMREGAPRDIELIRPDGLVERLPARPLPPVAGYTPHNPISTGVLPTTGDRRRRRRPPGEPWRGRLVDRLV